MSRMARLSLSLYIPCCSNDGQWLMVSGCTAPSVRQYARGSFRKLPTRSTRVTRARHVILCHVMLCFSDLASSWQSHKAFNS
jgi:hypothetical protein